MGSPVVGIDLGTTNSCLAWTGDGEEPSIFPVEQLTLDGRAERAILPSVLYAPIAEEQRSFANPFCESPWITGELARSRGEEVIGRTVTSAKSWLSHPSADPDEPSLPRGAPAGAPRLSAIDASARILGHLARAFEAKTRRHLADLSVVLTLPASFDEGARAATLEAARRVGLRPALLEEPQAAFYDYMGKKGAIEALLGRKKDALVLVVDVGGGTTDLSLVTVQRHAPSGPITCTRVATGDHLLLGGDNMDLALAELVRARWREEGEPKGANAHELDAFRMGQLVQQCRAAKEALLSEDAPDAFPIVVVGHGGKLVGGALTARVTRNEVRRAILDGFFPAVEEGRLPPMRRAALVAGGLPFARDPAITRHIARFLERYADGRAPSAVLLNGGVFRSTALRKAVAAAIRSRTGARVMVLEESDPDLAVARGAARYGVVRASGGLRIEAGATRSYYVGVGTGTANEHRAVCVLPRGTLEGVRCEVAAPILKLRTGELARFDLYRARTGVIHTVGDVLEPDEKSFARLRPLVTRALGAAGQVDVVLSGELTPVGTIDLSLREVGGKRRVFSLAFQVRAPVGQAVPSGAPSTSGDVRERVPAQLPAVVASPKLRQAESLLGAAFSFANKKNSHVAQALVGQLEKVLGDRLGWNIIDARRLFDVLMEHRGARRWSADHERVFWALAGLCLRPGFGAPEDERRVAELVPMYAQRISFADRAPVAQAFFVAWRRVSPGLDRAAQASTFDDSVQLLHEPRSRHVVGEAELRELITWLERVDVTRKIAFGERLVDEMVTRASVSPNLLSGLARIATRVPVYGEARDVIPPEVVEGWLERLPPLDWSKPSTAVSVLRLARVTDVGTHDLRPKVRKRLAAILTEHGAAPETVRPLKVHVPVSTLERGASFGETLPPGLTLSE